MILSNWKLTFDPAGTPLVLLAYGDAIEGELRFPLKRGLEVVPLADAPAPFLRATGNSVVTIEFDVFPYLATDALARAAVMQSLITADALAKKPLKVEVSGVTDKYWLFSTSYLSDHNPGRRLQSARARLVKSYTLTCTGLSEVAVP